jgi:hypothetical protein
MHGRRGDEAEENEGGELPVSTSANPACMNTTSNPVVSVQTMLRSF